MSLSPIACADAMKETVLRCIEIVEEQQRDFLDERYSVGQPMSSLCERAACTLVILRIKREYGLDDEEAG